MATIIQIAELRTLSADSLECSPLLLRYYHRDNNISMKYLKLFKFLNPLRIPLLRLLKALWTTDTFHVTGF